MTTDPEKTTPQLSAEETRALLEKIKERMVGTYRYAREHFKLGNGDTPIIISENQGGENLYWHTNGTLTIKYGPSGQGEISPAIGHPLPLNRDETIFKTTIFPAIGAGFFPNSSLICDSEAKDQLNREFALEQAGENHYILPRGTKYPTSKMVKQFNPTDLVETTKHPFNIYVVDQQ